MLIILAAVAAAFGGYLLGSRRPVQDVIHDIVAEAKSDADIVQGEIGRFKAEYADDWEAIRLTPFQHGVEVLIEKLKG